MGRRFEVAREPLACYPSAVEEARALGEALGVSRLYVKRDDLASGVFGGGKARKLALLLGEARELGRRQIVTFGAAGSNQAVAAARFGATLGMRVVVYLAPQVPGPHVRRNLLATARAGAEIRFTESLAAAEAEVARDARFRDEAYVVPVGGSSPRGDLAFVEAAFELDAQVRAGVCPAPDVVVVACGTGGTAAGLAVGLRLAGRTTEVLAVRASSLASSSRARIDGLARAVAAHARRLDGVADASSPSVDRAPTSAAALAITIDADELGRGYGYATAAGERAVAAAHAAGLELEPVYTGKALAAVARRASSLRDRVVLFWATQNGAPLDDGDEGIDALPPPLRAYARR